MTTTVRLCKSIVLSICTTGAPAVCAQSTTLPASVESPPTALQVNFSVKSWFNDWNSWITDPIASGVGVGSTRVQVVQDISSSTRVSILPAFSIRYQNFFASATAMLPTHYTFVDSHVANGFDVKARREEFDLAGGYFLAPPVALTVSVKRLTQTYGSDRYTWTGPVVALTGQAHLTGPWALYGTASAGVLRARFPAGRRDADHDRSFSSDYRLGESGVTYSMPGLMSGMRGLVATFGYRAQYVVTKGYRLGEIRPGDTEPRANVHTRLTDSTQGWVVGLLAVF